MNRTLTVVFDDISEWSNSYGTFYSVGALFDDGSILQANKKTRQDAQELRATLLQVLDIECDFYCDDKGLSQNGNQKWALKAILDLEGGPIYGKIPQGGGGTSTRSAATRPPEPPTKDAEIRAAVALKAAAYFLAPDAASRDNDVLKMAEVFEAWLESKSSGVAAASPSSLDAPTPDSSEGRGEGDGEAPKDPAPTGTSYEERWKGMGITTE